VSRELHLREIVNKKVDLSERRLKTLVYHSTMNQTVTAQPRLSVPTTSIDQYYNHSYYSNCHSPQSGATPRRVTYSKGLFQYSAPIQGRSNSNVSVLSSPLSLLSSVGWVYRVVHNRPGQFGHRLSVRSVRQQSFLYVLWRVGGDAGDSRQRHLHSK